MYWANFLHIYQPPTQTREIVEKVADECYRKLVKILSENPYGKITLNINACLTEQLAKYGLGDIIDGLKESALKGQIEFTGSAKYHPILPLIPENEIRRQIKLNEETNMEYFGPAYSPSGFFPPEMCYSAKVAQIAYEMGYSWIIIDEIAMEGKIGRAGEDILYRLKGMEDFLVFFKNRNLSAAITYGKCKNIEELKEYLGEEFATPHHIISGTDGEVYGHHRPGQEKLLVEAFHDPRLKTCRISDLPNFFKEFATIDPLPSSWSTWEDEMSQNIPYPQWHYPGNEIHAMQWELANLSINAVNGAPESAPGWPEARKLLDEGLHSCQWWWASCKPWWDTGMIDRGADLLLTCAEKLKDAVGHDKVDKALNLCQNIKNTARSWHESGRAALAKKEYLESHGEVSSTLTFG